MLNKFFKLLLSALLQLPLIFLVLQGLTYMGINSFFAQVGLYILVAILYNFGREIDKSI